MERLQGNGQVVFPVSPRISARARERYKVAAVEDDWFDAFVLADTLRQEHVHWRPLTVPSPLLAEIRALTLTGTGCWKPSRPPNTSCG